MLPADARLELQVILDGYDAPNPRMRRLTVNWQEFSLVELGKNAVKVKFR
jgi:hypothetical protein